MTTLARRPRRLRTTPAIRRLVAETRVHPAQLVLPVFVADGLSEPRPIGSMPGVVQHTLDSVARGGGSSGRRRHRRDRAVRRPRGRTTRTPPARPATPPTASSTGRSPRCARRSGDDLPIIADTCLDEFTDHGHCGVLDAAGRVDNDATVELYVRQAVSQAEAGAHFVSPSGMMDGQVAAIRAGLDVAGHTEVGILAYAVKYASAFYGPFREAVGSSLVGDRRTYQQDPANRREGRLEAALDELEGADMVMVKPASHYLDVLADVAAWSRVPVAAYQVSGEYAMIAAAAERGWIDRQAALTEAVTSIVRAGADIVLTYAALELAGWLK